MVEWKLRKIASEISWHLHWDKCTILHQNVQNIDIILFIIHRNEIEEQEDNFSKILENCFTLYKNGIKKVNQTLSLTLLFMITFALIGLVSSVYTTLSFIFFTGKNHVLGKVIDTKYYKQ